MWAATLRSWLSSRSLSGRRPPLNNEGHCSHSGGMQSYFKWKRIIMTAAVCCVMKCSNRQQWHDIKYTISAAHVRIMCTNYFFLECCCNNVVHVGGPYSAARGGWSMLVAFWFPGSACSSGDPALGMGHYSAPCSGAAVPMVCLHRLREVGSYTS